MKVRTASVSFLLAILLAFSANAAQIVAKQEVPKVPVTSMAINQLDGSTMILWQLSPSDSWHLYSDRLNDTGFPPALTMQWPEGWTAGPLKWPVAERYVMKGDILDHVYHEPVTLVQEVRIPVKAFAGGEVNLSAQWDWLACREICVPGTTHAEVVFSDSGPSAEALAMQDEAMNTLPKPIPDGQLNFTWTRSSITLEARGSEWMEFHPSTDCIRLLDVIADGASASDTMTLRLHHKRSSHDHLRGILSLKQSDGSIEAWIIDVLTEVEP